MQEEFITNITEREAQDLTVSLLTDTISMAQTINNTLQVLAEKVAHLDCHFRDSELKADAFSSPIVYSASYLRNLEQSGLNFESSSYITPNDTTDYIYTDFDDIHYTKKSKHE